VKGVTVIGAGLAGCEAALQCARRGVSVRLFEMRPQQMTDAHETGDVAELVCSNSLKSDEPTNAHGLLKAELRVLGSVLLECAERARVPGGKALVVDRRRFSAEVKAELECAGVTIERAEIISLPSTTGENGDSPEGTRPRSDASNASRMCPQREDAWYSPHFRYRLRCVFSDPYQPTVDMTGPSVIPRESDESRNLSGETPRIAALPRGDRARSITIIATGPLTSPAMADALQALLGTDRLFFYDAIAPIVSAESLDMTRVFEGSRYDAGSDYLNCPMNEEGYDRFVQALLAAELHPLHSFERVGLGHDPDSAEGIGSCPAPQFFEGCLPVEEIARRGRLALAFGPMKPVGLADPRTGKRPFAVVQLRRENADETMYNLVGFQTRLKQGEQERVFRMIPGLEKAAFLRLGSMHRNTYLDSPRVLLPTLQTRPRPDVIIAGQLTGVEGYVESIGAGLVAGINAARLAKGEGPLVLPREMMMGSLLAYVAGSGRLGHDPNSAVRIGSCPARFQPMNANFGLLPLPENRGQSPAAKTRPQSGTVPVFRLRGRDKRRAIAERALAAAREFASASTGSKGPIGGQDTGNDLHVQSDATA